ncbi:50S ribosomal protein L10 [Hyphomicrobiales bacterium]|nr:50S ribosomal protein L10 [Hyphomicrobiales bacterium]
MDRASKEKIVSSLSKAFDEANFLIVTQNDGLTVEEMSSLRGSLRESNTSFRVAKNSLAKIAVNNTDAQSLQELFNGPTAIAFSDELSSSPKVIVDFVKEHEKLSIVGGLMDGKLIDAEVIKELATLPSMDQLRSMIIGVLNAPATKVAGILNRPGGQLAQVLNAKAQQEETA